MKMNKTELNVAMSYILEYVNDVNYGMRSGGFTIPRISFRDQSEFIKNGWSIDRTNNRIKKDGVEMYRIRTSYGKGGKMLKPKLEYIGG